MTKKLATARHYFFFILSCCCFLAGIGLIGYGFFLLKEAWTPVTLPPGEGIFLEGCREQLSSLPGKLEQALAKMDPR